MTLAFLEDYTTEVSFDPDREPIHVRELIPKDFYLVASLHDSDQDCYPLLIRLILNPEVLENYTVQETRRLMRWIRKNQIDGNLYEISAWNLMALSLLGGESFVGMEWLESLPMSRITIMMEAKKEYNAEITRQAKKKK
ncbi:hypothetical protein SCBWM1_gp80 [Synechococcus phage S-CBWM1]|uniref:Uncharacterized protein n=1 Tax=Synechococcus phage S-CBWM1 TaxID=2053653 RepID=A0A3G1L3J6_9CAUD|nr:hypothetical protein HOU61_gp117 [Synechococcus phage S-CBWM1]ATW62764.1 hypothetical protein SCBWM1_gp80 [Synechococcus phage S-CBWM1]